MGIYHYDFHIHTALSPCASDDMTPLNIVQMAGLKGLDVIAVCDHNTAGNARSVMQASKNLGGPLVIAGIEIETAEEIHMLALFADIDGAEACSDALKGLRFPVQNRPEIYGNQLLFDADDEPIGAEPSLLVVATTLGLYDVPAFVASFGGTTVPAHIFRPSHGVLSILGGIHSDMGFTALEDTSEPPDSRSNAFVREGYLILHNSDAHDLGLIAERTNNNQIDLPALSARAVIERIRAGGTDKNVK